MSLYTAKIYSNLRWPHPTMVRGIQLRNDPTIQFAMICSDSLKGGQTTRHLTSQIGSLPHGKRYSVADGMAAVSAALGTVDFVLSVGETGLTWKWRMTWWNVWEWGITFGCFLKWWYPTTMVFPTKNGHFGVFWGYHHLRKHPFQELRRWTMMKELWNIADRYDMILFMQIGCISNVNVSEGILESDTAGSRFGRDWRSKVNMTRGWEASWKGAATRI